MGNLFNMIPVDGHGDPVTGKEAEIARAPTGQRGEAKEQTPKAKAKGKDPDPRGTELVRLADEVARLKMENVQLKDRVTPKLVRPVSNAQSNAQSNKFDKAAYQRELMRKRRAEAKGKP